MREKFLSTLRYEMSKLQQNVHSGFDYECYRIHQRRLYDMIDIAYMLNIIDFYDRDKYKKHVRSIGRRYIKSL